MKIFEVRWVENVEGVNPEEKELAEGEDDFGAEMNEAFDVFGGFDGRTPLEKNWVPLKMELIQREGKRPLKSVDFPYRSTSVLIIKDSALTILGELLKNYGELLPLQCDDAELTAFNCLNLVDALDLGASEIEWDDDDEDVIFWLQRAIFVEEKLKGVDLFKLPQQTLGPIYASENFVALVEEAKLTGLEFKLLWES